MNKLLASFAALSLLAVCLTASAQPVPEVGQMATTADPLPANRLKTIDFLKGDEITGTWKHGDGAVVTGETHGDLDSLIDVRSNFLDEMVRSAEDL